MRYFMSIILRPDQEADGPSPELEAAMGPYMDRYLASGELISTAGLTRSGEGTRVVARDGRTNTVDGPFTEARELIGGYAVIEAPDHQAAVALATEFVKLHTDNGWPDITVEVRPIEGGVNY